MELAVLLLLLGVFIIFFKLLALIFKGAFYVLSIPFIIIGSVLAVVLVILFIPLAVVAGVLTVVFAPLFVLGPLLPLVLLCFGVYLVLKG
jgi:hypothetical protein